ncbi:ABC transporter permease [soil metagenome]
MLHNYLKIAYRNLLRQKAFSVINIAGLATGMACSILILLWVQDELSYDRFHAHADRIYRVNTGMGGENMAISPPPLAPALVEELPEVENAVRLKLPFSEVLLSIGDAKFEEKQVVFADSSFLRVFSFPLVEGDLRTAMVRSDSLLLTQKTARKYFGEEDAVGQTLQRANQHLFTVTGVLQDNPGNTHLQFDVVLPLTALRHLNPYYSDSVWSEFDAFTYLLLDKGFSPSAPALADLEGRVNELYRRQEKGMKVNLNLQPLPDIRLHSKDIAYNLIGESGNVLYVRLFVVIAVFILLIACINFMNLATARSARRAKEVGLRKVVGAGRPQLVRQFLGESLLITALALVLAVVLVELALPPFNQITGKALSVSFLSPQLLLGLLGIGLLTGLLSGSYPALFLSAFEPVRVLKGVLQMGSGNLLFRNGLVVVQFVVSIVLIVGTAVVYSQLHHIKNADLGYDKENLVYVPLKGELTKNVQPLRVELPRHPSTEHFTFVTFLPTGFANTTTGVWWEGYDPAVQPSFATFGVDPSFVEIFGTELRSGRNFSPHLATDSSGYLINEKAAQLMGLDPDSAVGFKFSFWQRDATVIGIVKDFNFKPVHHPVEPLILHMRHNYINYLVVRAQPGSLQQTIADLEQVWDRVNPAYPFTYGFIDQDLEQQYRAEERMGQIFNSFSLLAIFISCLGLYGLAAFTAEQRTKEIGIRKVLGASVASIVRLLSKNFIKLVGVAILIALPLAWYAMGRWLEDFAYRIDLEWWVFALAAGLALLIALLTVSFQSVKAALANPVKSLKANE